MQLGAVEILEFVCGADSVGTLRLEDHSSQTEEARERKTVRWVRRQADTSNVAGTHDRELVFGRE